MRLFLLLLFVWACTAVLVRKNDGSVSVHSETAITLDAAEIFLAETDTDNATELRTQLKQIRQDLDNVANDTEVQARFAEIEKRQVENHNTVVGLLNQTLDLLNSVSTKVDGMEAKVDSMDSKVTAIERTTNINDNRWPFIGFHARLAVSRGVISGYQQVKSYATTCSHCFDSGHFNGQTGYFTAPQDGVYLVDATQYLSGATDVYTSEYRLLIMRNTVIGTEDINKACSAVFTDHSPGNSYAISVSCSVHLYAGDTVGVWTYSASDNSYTHDANSYFSVVYLTRTSWLTHGGFVKRQGTNNYGSATWYRINQWTSQHEFGWNTASMDAVSDNPERGWDLYDGYFSPRVEGIYNIACNVRLDNGNAVTNNYYWNLFEYGSDTTYGTLDIFSVKQAQNVWGTSIFGDVYLREQRDYGLYTYASADSSWTIHPETTCSVALIEPADSNAVGFWAEGSTNSAGLNVGTYEVGAVTDYDVIRTISDFNGAGEFDRFSGRYYIPEDGIYHCTANLRLDQCNIPAGDANSQITAYFAIDGAAFDGNEQVSARRGGGNMGYYVTMHLSSSIRLLKGSYISVWMSQNYDDAMTIINDSSGFGCIKVLDMPN